MPKKMEGFQNRNSPRGGPEDFPTQPWATRALMEHVLPGNSASAEPGMPYKAQTVWEPAANRGYMARPLTEYFGQVIASDKHDYGIGIPLVDFLEGQTPADYGVQVDWIITNPPFNKAEDFCKRALSIARHGVAMFVRASFTEGMQRYKRLFKPMPPTVVAIFTERVPLVHGKVAQKAATQMPYAWFVWLAGVDTSEGTHLLWIPPCRKELERDEDYLQYGNPPEPAEAE